MPSNASVNKLIVKNDFTYINNPVGIKETSSILIIFLLNGTNERIEYTLLKRNTVKPIQTIVVAIAAPFIP